MFFTISSAQDSRLPHHSQIGDYWFSHDDGWGKQQESWYKGYFYPEVDHGNFLKIKKTINDQIEFEHDFLRGFPVWWDQEKKILTNFLGTGQQIWADQKIQLVNNNIQLDPATGYEFDLSYDLDIDTASDIVCENLIKKSQLLKDNDIPKKLFLTGGVDTAIAYSMLKYAGVDFETVDYEYVKYDWFLNNNWSQLKNTHFGYKQIHHWTEPTLLITGSYGDVSLFRSIDILGLWAAWHNINLTNYLIPDKYHTDYFLKNNNADKISQYWKNKDQLKLQFPTTKNLATQIVSIASNDYQHWHLGNTLTWTPLKDISLLKVSLSLDLSSAIEQAADASLSKKIIKKLCPNALSLVSHTKNINSRQNLTKN